MENAKIEKFKWDILVDFQTLWRWFLDPLGDLMNRNQKWKKFQKFQICSNFKGHFYIGKKVLPKEHYRGAKRENFWYHPICREENVVFCHNPIEAIEVAKLFTHVLSQKNLSNLNIQSDFFLLILNGWQKVPSDHIPSDQISSK